MLPISIGASLPREENKMQKPEEAIRKSEPVIPALVIVGILSERNIESESLLTEKVRWIFKRIAQSIPPLKKTPLIFRVLSPLAVRAERRIVQEALKIPDAQLEVVVPFDKEDYKKDSELAEPRAEFEEMLSKAYHVRQLSPVPSQEKAYDQVGRYIVDHCDILIAIGNEEPSADQDRIAEIVQHAQKRKCPIFWISTDKEAKVSYEPGEDVISTSLQSFERYNSETAGTKKIERNVRSLHQNLLAHAKQVRFPLDRLRVICEWILPHFSRVDILAERYQQLYFKAGSLIYSIAAAAVAVAAFQALFLSDMTKVILIEVVFIIAVFIIFWLGSYQKWHSKWIDYRFLAERFRSVLFMSLADVEVSTMRPPRHLSLSYSSQDWIVDAFFSIWNMIPKFIRSDSLELKQVREFLVAGWIDDQIFYFKNSSRRCWRRHRQLSLSSYILFGLTFVAALLHVLYGGTHLFHHLFAFLSIVFPAVAGALGAIRTHREYLKNAMRSSEMVRHLQEIKEKMSSVKNLKDLIPLVREAEETMLRENEDWRVIVRFHELEPSA